MKTDSLRDLAARFENDQAYFTIAAEFEADRLRRAQVEQRARALGMVASQIRGEIRLREAPDVRPAGDAGRFESYLEHVLQGYPGTW